MKRISGIGLIALTLLAFANTAPGDEVLESSQVSATSMAVAIGIFKGADGAHKATGAVTIYALEDDRLILRFDNFRTRAASALSVYLVKHKSPTAAAEVTDNGFISLGKLQASTGNQEYAIPDSVDLTEYQSVVLWSEQLKTLFAPAPLIKL